MNKLDKINYIKSIVNEFGEFRVVDVESEGLLINRFNKVTQNSYQMINSLCKHRLEVITYVNGIEDETEFISYEELPEHVIESLLPIVQEREEKELYSKY